jgi:hypothetical protein
MGYLWSSYFHLVHNIIFDNVLFFSPFLQYIGIIKSVIFWDITPCSPLRVNGRFGGTYHLYLQGRKKAQQEPDFFDPEDGSDMSLQNVGSLSTDCTALYPGIW